MSLASIGLNFVRRLFKGASTTAEREAGAVASREVSHVVGREVTHLVDAEITRTAGQVLGRDTLVRRGEAFMKGKVLRKAAGQTGLEGGHIAKEIKIDQAGQKWIAKGFKDGMEYRAIGDKVGSDVARALGVETPVMHMREVTLGGKRQMATVQRLIEHSGERLPQEATQLSKKQVDQLTTSQVVRWVIGDHDGKTANFLVMKNGDVMPIDFGNIFRHFPDDKLAKNYVPNWEEPVYNRIWTAYSQGKLDVDFLPALAMIHKVEQLADDDFVRLLQPYVQARYATPEIPAALPTAQAFLDAALARKRNIRADFTSFYDGLARERGLQGGLVEALKLK